MLSSMSSPHLTKQLLAVVVPSLLFAALMFQLLSCRNRLQLRNVYLLESLPSRSDWIWDALSGVASLPHTSGASLPHDQHSAVLQPGLPTLTVHYIWCTEGYFELGHYLAILSVVRQLQPDRIVIHYRTEPREDPQGYWRWLEDLERTVAMLSLRPLSNNRLCSHDLTFGVTHDKHDFLDPFGVFLLGDVAVHNLSRAFVKDLMLGSFSDRQSEHELGKSQVFLVPDSEPYYISRGPGRVVISCPSVAAVNSLKQLMGVTCININTYVSPDDLFKRDNYFFSFTRNVLYGSPKVIETELSSVEQIPNTVHIVLLDNVGDLTPLHYISIKSAYIRGGVSHVYVHGTTPPHGKLWDRLVRADEINPKYIPTPSSLQLGTKHASHVYLLYILLQHGGIAHFGDVVFLHPVPSLARQAGALATQHYSQYRLKHRSINTAIVGGSKSSVFLESLLARLRQEDVTWPDTQADNVASHVTETNPESILLDPRLVSHQRCDKTRCQLEGGHSHPSKTYTTRFLWQAGQPSTLDQFLHLDGPTKSDIKEIIDISHTLTKSDTH